MTKTKEISKLIHLRPEQLENHPRNMRRFYPSKDVQEMAASILANSGVVEPLVVMKVTVKKYVVIDGNMRLTGARTLGDQCPPLECKVVKESEADQLLTMVIANQVRYDVDPVSEGLHYMALKKQGLSARQISKRTGVYEARISKRLILARLPLPIQKLIAEKKLPADEHAAKALHAIDPGKAVRLAERLAQNPNVKIKTIIAAAERLRDNQIGKTTLDKPAAEISGALRSKRKSAPIEEIRNAAAKTCSSCNQYEGKLRETKEPAWSMLVHSANDTCSSCPLKEMQNICGSCPVVQLLKRMVKNE